MSTTRKPARTDTPLRVEGELTIFRATELKPVLLGEAATTEIDLSGVSEIDTAGLQLLMVARRQAQAQQRRLRLVHRSAAVDALIERLNLAAFFGDALEAAPSAARTPRRRAAAPASATEEGL